ncbi:hypothetical protein EVAR_35845_1 [Eumeta japonica]|uniref:Uncharacterized protein n=1 Tax=Eumeta variegata TaxID=151549 RepID=A0A4C1WXL8_EUMVA|nr:hypothetical protein EVAR_35845_1 [Eumeta japonica]
MKSNKSAGGFCRACFSDTNLYVASEEVAKAYRNFVAKPDPEEPLCFCSYCGHLFHKVVLFLQQCSDANRLLESFDNQKEANLDVCYNLEIVKIVSINIYPSGVNPGSASKDDHILKIEEEFDDDSPPELPDDVTLDPPEALSDDSSSQDIPISQYFSQDCSEDEQPIRKSTDFDGTISTKETTKQDQLLNLNNEVRNKQNPLPEKSTRSEIQDLTAESDEDSQLSTSINNDEDPLKSLQINFTSSHKTGKTAKRRRSKDFCFFCEKKVSNYARHLFRHHRTTPEVRKILCYPVNSKERKDRITSLRKKGNYVINRIECQRPMRKGCTESTDYLPCINCLGFYARKQLWKHKKKCTPYISESNVQVTAQNFICDTTKLDPLLQKHVFSRMRADRISLTAKKDSLICRFGVHYLKIHHVKLRNFVHVTSRKMRELAKLLIEIQNMKPEIKTLVDALQPQNYDVVVLATKLISKYDATRNNYTTPTYPMNISASLRLCCNLAIAHVAKSISEENSKKKSEDLREFLNLVKKNWRFNFCCDTKNISSNSVKDSAITLVTLGTDLKLLNQYLSSKANIAASQLAQEKSSNVTAYIDLLKTVFSRALLLNRIPSGDLEVLTLQNYQDSESFKSETHEFDDIFMATEMILYRHYRCVVRSKGFPILFSPELQDDIEMLISLRSMYIDDSNVYLFAIPNAKSLVDGNKVLYRNSDECGVSNPNAIVSPKLRKHTAVLTQLLSMSENHFDQFSKFMHDTYEIQLNSYKPSDDIFRTAKILKVLILLKNENADNLKGKSLDEINLHVEEVIEGETMSVHDVIEYAEIVNYEDSRNITKVAAYTTRRDIEKKSSVMKKSHNENSVFHHPIRKRVLTPWTSEQKEIVLNYFQKHIELKKVPKRHECDALKVQHPVLLSNKDWLKIKVFIQNAYMKRFH